MTCSRFSGLSSPNQRRVPVFPHRLITQAANQVGDFARRALIGNLELSSRMDFRAGGRPFARAEFHNSAALRMMKLLLACAGVTAWLSMTARAHQRNANGNKPIAQLGGLAG